MNGIRLFFKSAKGSVFSSLTLFVVLGAVLLTLNYTLSQYLYIRRAGEMFENAGLSGGLHFVNTTPYDAEGQEALDARIESLRESGEMEKLITRRSAGVTIGGTEYQLVLYDVDVYPAMYGAPHKGSWPEGGEPLGGVVAGVNPSSVPVGETVMVRSSIPGNDASLEVQITGTLAYPPMTFQTGYYISNISMMTADNFFGEERLLYVPYSEAAGGDRHRVVQSGQRQPRFQRHSAVYGGYIRRAAGRNPQGTVCLCAGHAGGYDPAKHPRTRLRKHAQAAAGAAVPAGGYVAGLHQRRRARHLPPAGRLYDIRDGGLHETADVVARRRAVGPAPAVHRRFGRSGLTDAETLGGIRKICTAGRPVRLAEFRADRRRIGTAAYGRHRHRRVHDRTAFAGRGAAAGEGMTVCGGKDKTI